MLNQQRRTQGQLEVSPTKQVAFEQGLLKGQTTILHETREEPDELGVHSVQSTASVQLHNCPTSHQIATHIPHASLHIHHQCTVGALRPSASQAVSSPHKVALLQEIHPPWRQAPCCTTGDSAAGTSQRGDNSTGRKCEQLTPLRTAPSQQPPARCERLSPGIDNPLLPLSPNDADPSTQEKECAGVSSLP